MRPSNFIGIAVCVFSLLTAYYFLQIYLKLPPCPLCILDRFVVGAMGLVFFAGLFTVRIRTRIVLLCCNAVLLCFGLLFAGRHVWLQNLPYDFSKGCLADSPVAHGLIDAIRLIFNSEVDCTLILWQVLGLTIPDLTLLMFIGFGILLVSQLWGIREEKIANDN